MAEKDDNEPILDWINRLGRSNKNDMKESFNLIETDGVPIRAWTKGVPVEAAALQQLRNTASLPIIHKAVLAMPDVHLGLGATVGSVVPTVGAIIPAAVGVDIGCGMMAWRTSLGAEDLPDSLGGLRSEIEAAVPHGRDRNGGPDDCGSWSTVPDHVARLWALMDSQFKVLCESYPGLERCNSTIHLGTLGTGNHFIEVCLDEADKVWVMLHSGSRGVGNRIGSHFIALAKKDMGRHIKNLPDRNLAYLSEGSEHFDSYIRAVGWAQQFALWNRELMMDAVMRVLRESKELPLFTFAAEAINCHHNYVAHEFHYDKWAYVTRKGAVSARKGQLGIIPGSMGAKSYIVSGLGNPESFHTCSHGAGRVMSRTEAKKRFTTEDHCLATSGVECRKDVGVLDETPGAYKDIDAVMAAQKDLVDIKHTLKQVLCVKG